MTRTRARDAAVRLICAQAATGQEPDGLVDDYFEPEHLASLAGEEGAITEMPDEKQLDYIKRVVRAAAERRAELGGYIRRYALGWRPERISRTAVAVLSCAMTEILYLGDGDVSPEVAINEAVELAKSFEEPETVSFINGVLGGFVRGELGGAQNVEQGAEQAGEAEAGAE